MGQKIHPTGYRIGIIEPWASRWHGGKNFAEFLLQDKQIRDHVQKEYGSAGIPRIEIERTGEAVNVGIYTACPGVLVGRKGVRLYELKEELQKIYYFHFYVNQAILFQAILISIQLEQILNIRVLKH